MSGLIRSIFFLFSFRSSFLTYFSPPVTISLGVCEVAVAVIFSAQRRLIWSKETNRLRLFTERCPVSAVTINRRKMELISPSDLFERPSLASSPAHPDRLFVFLLFAFISWFRHFRSYTSCIGLPPSSFLIVRLISALFASPSRYLQFLDVLISSFFLAVILSLPITPFPQLTFSLAIIPTNLI